MRRLQQVVWLILVLALLAPLAAPVSAAPIRTTESGVITTTTLTPTRVQQAGPVQLIDATFVDQFAGFLTGTGSGTTRQVVNSQTGTAVFYGTEVCTCTAAGRSGTITVFFEGTTAANGISEGTIVFFGGTAGLAGLTGQASFRGNLAQPIPYTGTFIFPS
jgi:Protein of unknown function (DUF3224)